MRTVVGFVAVMFFVQSFAVAQTFTAELEGILTKYEQQQNRLLTLEATSSVKADKKDGELAIVEQETTILAPDFEFMKKTDDEKSKSQHIRCE